MKDHSLTYQWVVAHSLRTTASRCSLEYFDKMTFVEGMKDCSTNILKEYKNTAVW